MKLRNFLLCVSAAAALLSGCQDDKPLESAPSLTLDPAELTFEAAAASQTITLTSTRYWKVNGELPEWVDINLVSGVAVPDGATLEVTVTENAGEDRSASIEFTIETISKNLEIFQKGKGIVTDKPAGDGTADSPYSVAAALAITKALAADAASKEVYIKGIISEIQEIDTGQYGNATYYISDDGEKENQFMVYRGYYVDGKKFTAKDQIKVGDKVIIFGKLINYKGDTPEVNTGSRIVSLNEVDDDNAKKLSVSPVSIHVSAEAESATFKVNGNVAWTASVTGGDFVKIQSGASGNGSGEVVLKLTRNDSETDARTAKITVSTTEDAATKSYAVTIAQARKGTVQGVAKGWLELPATPEGLEYHANFFSMNGQTYRNYSYVWDREALVAHWVAYPLASVYLGSLSRTDKWAYDPNVPSQYQPNLTKSFSGNYDRGHQLPSADRTCCTEANEQTFYFTNMTPQLDVLNQKIWASFETTVRDWSRNADTLYVVTGCTVKDSKTTATDRDGTKVKVPTGYFKAVLWYSSTSTQTSENAGFRGAAFYLEHRGYSESNINKSMSMSIDELEELVGMDFFPNLEAKVGKEIADRVEASDPKVDAFWW